MPSPFPGMDPYLEDDRTWPDFHHVLVTCLYEIVLPGLVDRYRVRVGQRRYFIEPGGAAPEGSASRLEEYIEIHQRSDGRLVTLMDVVSPSNKVTEAGRQAYLQKRRECRAAGANLVEIDLVLQGQPLLDYSREGLPDWDYAVTVTRADRPDRFEVYTATLQKRLPRFRLPLTGDDRDQVVDSQAAFLRAYDEGGFASRIDYAREPPVARNDEDRRWLDDLLKQQGVRPAVPRPPASAPTEEAIAITAYYLWQKEGRPPGRDQEFWFRAMEELKRGPGSGPGPAPGTGG